MYIWPVQTSSLRSRQHRWRWYNECVTLRQQLQHPKILNNNPSMNMTFNNYINSTTVGRGGGGHTFFLHRSILLPELDDCLQPCPPCWGLLSAVQGWLAAETLSCLKLILSLIESRGQHFPHPFSIYTPLGADKVHTALKTSQAQAHTRTHRLISSFSATFHLQLCLSCQYVS